MEPMKTDRRPPTAAHGGGRYQSDRARMPTTRARRRVRHRGAAAPREHHRAYVVLLKDPAGDGRDGYYVGMTGPTPEERFANHQRGKIGQRRDTLRRGAGLRVVRRHSRHALP